MLNVLGSLLTRAPGIAQVLGDLMSGGGRMLGGTRYGRASDFLQKYGAKLSGGVGQMLDSKFGDNIDQVASIMGEGGENARSFLANAGGGKNIQNEMLHESPPNIYNDYVYNSNVSQKEQDSLHYNPRNFVPPISDSKPRTKKRGRKKKNYER